MAASSSTTHQYAKPTEKLLSTLMPASQTSTDVLIATNLVKDKCRLAAHSRLLGPRIMETFTMAMTPACTMLLVCPSLKSLWTGHCSPTSLEKTLLTFGYSLKATTSAANAAFPGHQPQALFKTLTSSPEPQGKRHRKSLSERGSRRNCNIRRSLSCFRALACIDVHICSFWDQLSYHTVTMPQILFIVVPKPSL